MLVREVMVKPVFTVTKDASFGKILKTLVKRKVSGVTVIDSKRKVVGVVSEKDLLHELFPSQKNFYKHIEYYKNFERIEVEAEKVRKLKAKDVMTKEVVAVEPDNHVLVACSLMAIHGIRRLPVINKNRLVGIVTMGSLYKHYLSSFFKH